MGFFYFMGITDNHRETLHAVDQITGEPFAIEGDSSTGSIKTTSSASGGSSTERYDYDDATTIYTATAPVGTAEGSTGWKITKYDLTDTNNASGKVATDVSWTDRATGAYA